MVVGDIVLKVNHVVELEVVGTSLQTLVDHVVQQWIVLGVLALEVMPLVVLMLDL